MAGEKSEQRLHVKHTGGGWDFNASKKYSDASKLRNNTHTTERNRLKPTRA